MANDKNRSAGAAFGVKLALYAGALCLSVFLGFSLSTWLFGFGITRLGGNKELFLSYLLAFGLLYIFDGFISINARVNDIYFGAAGDKKSGGKVLVTWFAGFTALTVAAVVLTNVISGAMVMGKIEEAARARVPLGFASIKPPAGSGKNAAADFIAFVNSHEYNDINFSEALLENKELFPYFLERKWTSKDIEHARAFLAANGKSIDRFKEIIRSNDYLYTLRPGVSFKGLNAYTYLRLAEFTNQLGIETKIKAGDHDSAGALEDLGLSLKLLSMLKHDPSGLLAASASIAVQSSIAPVFAALLSEKHPGRQFLNYLENFVRETGVKLTEEGMKQEIAITIEKYSLIKKRPAMLREVTGLSGFTPALSLVTGAFDISFYRLLKEYLDTIAEMNVRQYTDISTLPEWPYMFTKRLAPNLISFSKGEWKSAVSIKMLNVLRALRSIIDSKKELPRNLKGLLTMMPKEALLDPFARDTEFRVIKSEGSLVLYSSGLDVKDDNGSIQNDLDLGHILYY